MTANMKSLDINELVGSIEDQGIKVVHIDYSEFKATRLKGDRDNFVAAVKAFDEKVVFLQDFSFDEDDFFHELKKPVLGEYDNPPTENGIDLRQFLPELGDYKRHLGQTSAIILRVFYKNHYFSYWQNAEWYDDFTEQFERARVIFEEKERLLTEKHELELNAARESREKRETYLRGLLENFTNDENFISLKTQKMKQEYAIAQYPELAELSQFTLKEEISNLNARIEARKMLQ
jgi:hypothetical protein